MTSLRDYTGTGFIDRPPLPSNASLPTPVTPSPSTPSQPTEIAAPIGYPLMGVASFVARHSLNYPPRVVILDSDGNEMEAEITHGLSAVYLTFSQPFYGTLFLSN